MQILSQPCQITQQVIWGNQTSVFMKKQKPSEGFLKFLPLEQQTNLIYIWTFFFSLLFQRNKWPTLWLHKHLTLSYIFKLPLSAGSFPLVFQHLPSYELPLFLLLFIVSSPLHFTIHRILAMSFNKIPLIRFITDFHVHFNQDFLVLCLLDP